MVTTVLELVGLALLIAATCLGLGLAPALLAGGVACLVVSWRLTWARERAQRRGDSL